MTASITDSMISPLSKISIASRALFPPVLLAVVMIGVVVLFWTTYRAIEQGNRLSMRAGLAIEQARHFVDEFHLGHTALYRAVGLKSQGVEQRVVSDKTAAAFTSLDKAARALEMLASSGVVAEVAPLERARQAFEAYLASAREAADFVETEAFVAAMYLNGADRKFLDAQENASAIAAALAAHRERIDQDAAAALATALTRIGMTTALAILLSLAVAASFTRMVAAQASAVAETTAANDKLRLAYGRLEQQSAELVSTAKRLETAVVAAESANRAKSLFLANMSHELRTPLNAILGYAQLFKRDHALDEWQTVAIDTIQRSGDHLLTLISDILDLSKIEAGRLELSTGIVDLRAFIRDIENIVRVRASTRDLSFVQETSADLPDFVNADEKRLRQVLLNLLGNAVKFTDRGRVELRVGVLSRSEHHAVLRFEVKDSGVGIAPEKLETAFKPFEQVCDPQRRSSGTGLGLSISQELLRLMGSKIEVESALGQGSRFWFDLSLPLSAEGLLPLAAPLEVTGYLGDRRRILIADDTPEIRAVLADALSRLGFEIDQAGDGLEGLRRAETKRPDLVLMDVMMPVMDGLQAIRRIRKSAELAALPVIAISASVSAEDEKASLAAGADAFLAKPIDHTRLLQQIAALLQLSWVEAPLQPTSAAETDAHRVVAPPQAEIDILYDLARAGNMRNIRIRADHVAALDPQYRAFADELRRMARAYDSKAVLDLIRASHDEQRAAVAS